MLGRACADGSCADGEGLGVGGGWRVGGGLGRDGLEAMIALNGRIVAEPQRFYGYATPTDFRLEMHFPALYPTNVRPETLEQEREWKRRAEVGELRKEPFLRFTSAVGSGYPENDVVNARWYEARQSVERRGIEDREGKGEGRGAEAAAGDDCDAAVECGCVFA